MKLSIHRKDQWDLGGKTILACHIDAPGISYRAFCIFWEKRLKIEFRPLAAIKAVRNYAKS